MQKLTFLLTLVVSISAGCVDKNNPDQGKLTRYLCYQIDIPGDPNSRNQKFSIVITQDNMDVHDAANFVPGNKLASEFGTQTIPFTVQVFDFADSISNQRDSRLYVSELLSENATATYRGQGGRMMNSFSIYWDDYDSYVYFKANDALGSAFVLKGSDFVQQDHRYVWCEAPWAILSVTD